MAGKSGDPRIAHVGGDEMVVLDERGQPFTGFQRRARPSQPLSRLPELPLTDTGSN